VRRVRTLDSMARIDPRSLEQIRNPWGNGNRHVVSDWVQRGGRSGSCVSRIRVEHRRARWRASDCRHREMFVYVQVCVKMIVELSVLI
jgi:hypothetical protein